ncbi:Na+/H+ antiporter NhaA [Steroidobacter agaridevorans]|uniref:Na+/H+ antiporter NhaA n=1 Tax=Steroidobacter agaridevorans TaxID=2695856 RepID=UPI001321F400|nr:Na+/H+ antiporter NhaA [Steroidobacter agaridevorans]GFE87762.1 Na(+)/H(+) antiporter NhaA [Steroidobacter agaridevorans]
MNSPNRAQAPAAPQILAERFFAALERFLHIEAVSGIVLLLAAAAALGWANSPWAASYEHVWHTPISISIGTSAFSQSLHFWINDGLMTIFFLVVGMEIRREIHEGTLSTAALASLPVAAAVGGVVVPALIYLAINSDPALQHGWAIPTATDIAFAVGVLALLGRSIPGSIRIFLLALAIIDDIAAVLIIAIFYSSGLDYTGLLVAALGIAIVLGFQTIGIASAFSYLLPGVIVWYGLLLSGAHPTLAGVVLGLMTPVVRRRRREQPVEVATQALNEFGARSQAATVDERELVSPLHRLEEAQRDLLSPVVRVQAALHPWVAFGVMPLFALANAGVPLAGANLSGASLSVLAGVVLALVFGKPIGILLGSWLAVRSGLSRLPPHVTWQGLLVVGCLGGIGFTMSIFIAMLAFADARLLAAAKLGVLVASFLAAAVGLSIGRLYVRSVRSS